MQRGLLKNYLFIFLSMFLMSCSSYSSSLENLQQIKSDCTPVGQIGVPLYPMFIPSEKPNFDWKGLKESIEDNSFDWTNEYALVNNLVETLNSLKYDEPPFMIDCTQECSKVSCTFIKSIKENNKEICNSLPEAVTVTLISGGKYSQSDNMVLDYRSICLVYHLIHKKLSDTSFCSSLKEHTPSDFSVTSATSTKDYCYIYAARIHNNKELCLKIRSYKNPELKDATAHTSDLCLGNFAQVNGDISACDDYLDTQYKQNCYDAAYFTLAKKSNDAKICENIMLKYLRNECLQLTSKKQ